MNGLYAAIVIIGLGLLLVLPTFIKYAVEKYLDRLEFNKAKNKKSIRRAEGIVKFLSVKNSDINAETRLQAIAGDTPPNWQIILFGIVCLALGVYSIVFFTAFEASGAEINVMAFNQKSAEGSWDFEWIAFGLYSFGGKWAVAGFCLFFSSLAFFVAFKNKTDKNKTKLRDG